MHNSLSHKPEPKNIDSFVIVFHANSFNVFSSLLFYVVPQNDASDDQSDDVYNGSLTSSSSTKMKRVAVVEDFFQIIYGVHVEMDGRGGKHAGQKRTYRAVCY